MPMVVSSPWPGSTRWSSGTEQASSIDWMMVAKSPPANFGVARPAREQRVAAEQHRRALAAGSTSSRGCGPGCDGVQPQPADLDHLRRRATRRSRRGQHGRVGLGDARPRSRPRGWAGRPGCGPSGRGSRAPGARPAAAQLEQLLVLVGRVEQHRVAGPRQRSTNTLLSIGPTTTLWISSSASADAASSSVQCATVAIQTDSRSRGRQPIDSQRTSAGDDVEAEAEGDADLARVERDEAHRCRHALGGGQVDGARRGAPAAHGRAPAARSRHALVDRARRARWSHGEPRRRPPGRLARPPRRSAGRWPAAPR